MIAQLTQGVLLLMDCKKSATCESRMPGAIIVKIGTLVAYSCKFTCNNDTDSVAVCVCLI